MSTVSIADDLVGPRLVPNFLAISMMVLGLFIGVSAWLYNGNIGAAAASDALHAAEPEEDFGFRDSDFLRVASIVVMGFIYLVFFQAFGYLVATFLSLMLMLIIFGNRNTTTILVLSVIGTLIYNYVFMGMMNLHNPAGSLIDLQPYAEMIPFKFIRDVLAF